MVWRYFHNNLMRNLTGLAVVAAVAGGIYLYSVNKIVVTDPRTAVTQVISLTGVRMDLQQLAQSEKHFIAESGHCGSMGELLTSNAVAMTHAGREGYEYSVDCSGTDFTVVARHEPAPEGSTIRYPTLAIDSTMQVHEVN